MLTPKAFQFNSANLALVPSYRSKWQAIACNTKPLDREAANLSINQAYEFLRLANPNIIYFDNLNDALNFIYRKVDAC